jgi:hypothetical protein
MDTPPAVTVDKSSSHVHMFTRRVQSWPAAQEEIGWFGEGAEVACRGRSARECGLATGPAVLSVSALLRKGHTALRAAGQPRASMPEVLGPELCEPIVVLQGRGALRLPRANCLRDHRRTPARAATGRARSICCEAASPLGRWRLVRNIQRERKVTDLVDTSAAYGCVDDGDLQGPIEESPARACVVVAIARSNEEVVLR